MQVNRICTRYWTGVLTRAIFQRNCLLIHGITEGNQENTDTLALEIFKEKLDIELTQRDLDRAHWTSKNDLDSNRPKLVIVKRISMRYSGDAYSFQY